MSDPRKLAEGFVQDLRQAVGPRLQAASLFGSAARDEWIEGVSDVNVLVLLDDIDAPVLGRAAAAARDATTRGITPLLMEQAEWRRAADVFTIELADMKDSSVPLFGDDPASVLPIQPHVLRLQAERELRGKLLNLHAAMLMCADDARRLGGVFVHALPSFVTYMRAVLRLEGQAVPKESRPVIEAACRVCAAQPDPFLRVLDARSSRADLDVRLDEPFADEFNTAAERVAAHIDAFGR